jgi:hypothetical protein
MQPAWSAYHLEEKVPSFLNPMRQKVNGLAPISGQGHSAQTANLG